MRVPNRGDVLFEVRVRGRFLLRWMLLTPFVFLLLLGPSGTGQEPRAPLLPTDPFEPFFAKALPLVEPPLAFVQRASLSTHVDFVELADFDEDGIDDAMISADNVLQFHPGDGNGEFGFGSLNFYKEPQPDENGQVVIDLNPDEYFLALSHAAADFNNDGHLDVVAIVNFFDAKAEKVQQRLHTFLGNGHGVFKALDPVTLSENGLNNPDTSPFKLIAYDFDNDAFADVLIVRRLEAGTRFELMRNAGDGSFQAPEEIVFDKDLSTQTTLKVLATDLNGNGTLDLVVALVEQVKVFFDVEANTFASAQTLDIAKPDAPQPVVDVALGDLNQDGLDDVVLIQGQTVASYLFGKKAFFLNGTVDLGIVLSSLVLGDFNGDGFADIGIFADTLQLLGTVFGNGQGQFFFDKPIYEHVVAPPVEALVADLDGNGYDDLMARGEFFVQVLLRQSDPQGVSRTGIGNNALLGTADLDGDATTEVIVGNAPDLEVMWNNGRGVFLRQPLLKINEATLFLKGEAIDVQRDGRDEFVVLGLKQANDPSSGFLAVIGYDPAQGQAAVLTSQRLMIEAVPNLRVGDLNKDGLPEIVTNGKDAITVWSLDGALQLTAQTFPLEGPLSVLAVGDYDGDGGDEIMVGITKEQTASVVLFEYENGQVSAPQTLFELDASPVLITNADLNGDGVTDALLVGMKVEATLENEVLNVGITGASFIDVLGSGAGQFMATSTPIADWQNGETPLMPNGLAAGDFDGDAHPDAVMALIRNGVKLRIFKAQAEGDFGNGHDSACEGGVLEVTDFNHDARPELMSAGLDLNPHLCISWEGAF